MVSPDKAVAIALPAENEASSTPISVTNQSPWLMRPMHQGLRQFCRASTCAWIVRPGVTSRQKRPRHMLQLSRQTAGGPGGGSWRPISQSSPLVAMETEEGADRPNDVDRSRAVSSTADAVPGAGDDCQRECNQADERGVLAEMVTPPAVHIWCLRASWRAR